jgi:hypothetical protein
MNKGSKKQIKEETLMLSDLKCLDEKIEKNNPAYLMDLETESYEDIKEEKKEISQEIIEKNNKLKKESLELYYKIDNQKKKELETAFNQKKLKIKFDGMPRYLKKGKLYTISKTAFAIYDNYNCFKKIVEIKFEQEINPICAIQLENNDLVFACTSDKYRDEYELLIYRLNDKQYSLFQKMKEGGIGHLGRYVNYGHCSQSIEKVPFHFDNLIEISGNRFISTSNHGFKIYSLNEKNEYSIVSIIDYLDGIKYIHEISENKFIICTSKSYRNRSYYSYSYSENNEIYIQMMELKEITKEEINNKLDDLNKDGYQISRRYFSIFFVVPEKDKNFNDNELKTLIESLKLTCSFKGIMKFAEEERNYLSNYVLIKNNYFIIMINNSIFIIDSTKGNILKRYILLIDGISNEKIRYLFKDNANIQKWNNSEDNEFILLLNGNAILFELNEDEKEIVKLKILNYTYFPEIKNINNIKKINDGNNQFCSIEYDTNSVWLY